jgi:hypothetical protein
MARGQVLVASELEGPGITNTTHHHLLVGNAASFSIMARPGDVAPGTPTPMTFAGSLSRARVNSSGGVVFLGSAAGPAGSGLGTTGLWTTDGSGHELVVHTDQPAPGLGPGVVFDDFFPTSMVITFTPPTIAINDDGEVAFDGWLKGTGITSANNRGIWATQGGAPQLVAQLGAHAPGTSTTTTFVAFNNSAEVSGSRFSFNGDGEVAFRGAVGGTGVTTANDGGVWSGTPGNLQLIAREGDAVPDAMGDVRFAGFESPLLNDAGDLVFLSGLSGSDVSSTNDMGMFARVDGQLRLIAREGQLVDADPGPAVANYRIRNFGATSLTSSSRLTLSENRVIGFTVNFNESDNSVMTARLVRTNADFDGSGAVDAQDLGIWQTHYGTNGNLAHGDADDDGVINGSDFLEWQRGLGPAPAGSWAVPEPASLASTMGCLAALRCGRRRRVAFAERLRQSH